MKHTVYSLLLIPAMLLALLATSAFSLVPAAHAASVEPSHSDISQSVASGGYTITNVHSNGTMQEDVGAPITVSPGSTSGIHTSQSVSNSFGGTVTVTAPVVSAAVNFNVTATQTITTDCTYTNTSSQDQTLAWVAVFEVLNYDIDQNGTKVGTGYAYDYYSNECWNSQGD